MKKVKRISLPRKSVSFSMHQPFLDLCHAGQETQSFLNGHHLLVVVNVVSKERLDST
jgi:hypothetical protein